MSTAPCPNHVWLSCYPSASSPSHFQLYEFASCDGLAMVHPSLLDGLEKTRASLSATAHADVSITVSDALRSHVDNHHLGCRLGWTDDGGPVSRDSRHKSSYGGIAADIYAFITSTQEPVPQSVVARAARPHFDFVLGNYHDGHIHVDQRDRAQPSAGIYP